MSNPTDVIPVGQIASYTVKNIPFWSTCPDAWFLTLEAQFELARMTTSKTKYFVALGMLDQRTIQLCQDVIRSPSENEPYETLKDAVISRLVESADSKLQRLIRDLELGDRKPSQLLIEMRQLAGNQFNEDVLRKMWLQRLPNQTQAILTVSAEPLDKIAIMADRILSTFSYNSQVAEVKTNVVENSKTDLELKVEALSQKIDKISKSKSNDKFVRRSRSSSRSRNESGICWYHRRFKEKATKCTHPCRYAGSVSKNGTAESQWRPAKTA